MIILKDIIKQYKNKPALYNVNLHIRPGEFVFLTGVEVGRWVFYWAIENALQQREKTNDEPNQGIRWQDSKVLWRWLLRVQIESEGFVPRLEWSEASPPGMQSLPSSHLKASLTDRSARKRSLDWIARSFLWSKWRKSSWKTKFWSVRIVCETM